MDFLMIHLVHCFPQISAKIFHVMKRDFCWVRQKIFRIKKFDNLQFYQPLSSSIRIIALKRPEAAHLVKSTVMHELLHAMGLHHFDNSSKYGFQQFETDNIMDYSDLSTNIIAK
jgi:hypothetical protein